MRINVTPEEHAKFIDTPEHKQWVKDEMAKRGFSLDPAYDELELVKTSAKIYNDKQHNSYGKQQSTLFYNKSNKYNNYYNINMLGVA
ncbi:hypothetical protein WR164_12610 [Philodulcilactobacillus myokoensis]|uniref:Uncharacterized protein n=1 Tax=Philodulcilactobacillus myokoensis TaxID=2929573 RepID=A0A9W6B1M5_9LACO|nr:hypothetical protein [Philodulcilactobacillus myokoensis]GLB47282.1 hypothetical protein WR164_12610 [Philodulcilactobacillus myokoensis]